MTQVHATCVDGSPAPLATIGLPLGRRHVLPDLRNQVPSEMARYNGFLELEAYLRHFEDVTWQIPVVWMPPAMQVPTMAPTKEVWSEPKNRQKE